MKYTFEQSNGIDQHNINKPALVQWTKVMVEAIRSEFHQFVQRNKVGGQWPILQQPKQYGWSNELHYYNFGPAPLANANECIPIYSPPLALITEKPSFTGGSGQLFLETISQRPSVGPTLSLTRTSVDVISPTTGSSVDVMPSAEAPHVDHISPTTTSAETNPPMGTHIEGNSPVSRRQLNGLASPTPPPPQPARHSTERMSPVARLPVGVVPPTTLLVRSQSSATGFSGKSVTPTRKLATDTTSPRVTFPGKSLSPTQNSLPETVPSPSSLISENSDTPDVARQITPLAGDPSARSLSGRSPAENPSSSEDEEDLPDGDVYVDEDGYYVPSVEVKTCDPSKITWITKPDGKRWRLGTGTFASVEGANMAMEDGQVVPVAIKKFFSKNEVTFALEARLQSFLSDTGVFPKFHGVVQLEEGPSTVVCQVSQLFAGGKTVRNLLTDHFALSDAGWVEIVRQVAVGLQAIHQHRVIYNDLKGDNVLVDVSVLGRPVVKFIDLGLASFCEGKTFSLTEEEQDFYPHVAPEVKEGEETTFSADIWSLGILIGRIADQTDIEGLWVAASMCCREDAKDRSSLEEIVSYLQSINQGL